MKKSFFTSLSLLGILVCSSILFFSFKSSENVDPGFDLTDDQIVENLLRQMETIDLNSLPALPVEHYKLPSAGIEVMRVKMEETYNIEGIGSETIQLQGWIAVAHDNARAINKGAPIDWNNAYVPTEFVGMNLHAESELFGDVNITLNPSQRSIGQVGGNIPTDVTLTKDANGNSRTIIEPMAPMPFISNWK